MSASSDRELLVFKLSREEEGEGEEGEERVGEKRKEKQSEQGSKVRGDQAIRRGHGVMRCSECSDV